MHENLLKPQAAGGVVLFSGTSTVSGMLLAQKRLLTLLQHHAPRVAAPLLSRCQHTAENDAEVAEFRELVHDFASREIAPHAADIDRSNAFPGHVDLWAQMGHMGLHGTVYHELFSWTDRGKPADREWPVAGVTVPAEYGGLDLGYQQHCVAMEVRLQLAVTSFPDQCARTSNNACLCRS